MNKIFTKALRKMLTPDKPLFIRKWYLAVAVVAGISGVIDTAKAFSYCPIATKPYLNVPNSNCPVDTGPGYRSYSIPPPSDLFAAGVIGDSISVGRYADPQSAAYPNIVFEGLKALYPGRKIWKFNLAKDGHTTQEVLDVQVPETIYFLKRINRPVIIGLTAGGNDIRNEIVLAKSEGRAPDFKNAIENTVNNLREIVNRLKESSAGGVWIYVAVVYDPTDGVGKISQCGFDPGMPCALARLRDRYLSLGQELDFSVIDALGAFHGHGAYYCDTANPYYDSNNPTLWFADCVHPNNKGHAELGRLFLEAIRNQTTADRS